MSCAIIDTYCWDGIPVRIFSDGGVYWWTVWPDSAPSDYPTRAGVSRCGLNSSVAEAKKDAHRYIAAHKLPGKVIVRRRRWSVIVIAALLVFAADTGMDLWLHSTWMSFVGGVVVASVAIQAARRFLCSRHTQKAHRTEYIADSNPHPSNVALPKKVTPALASIDHALTGWKRAQLSFSSGTVRFVGAAHGSYGATATAACEHSRGAGYYILERPEPHAAPSKNCACGFYAARDRGKLAELAGQFSSTVCDLEVELSGHYVQYEHGYRAERQQVVSVRVDHGCRACTEDADCLVVAQSRLLPLCNTCATKERVRQFTAYAAGEAKSSVPPGLWRITLPDLAAQLGVHDIRWADRPALTERKD